MSKLDQLRRTLVNLLRELVDGPAPDSAFVLNPGDAGLLRSLDKLSAEEASAIAAGGGGSVAAHVDHLRYGLSLLNRWSNGEENPFATADYSASWQRTTVSADEWSARRDALRRELSAWREAIQHPRDADRELSDVELTGMTSSIVHLAYHIGAIRQIHRATRGPAASD